MNACTTVGSVWPALSVPGITRSGTIRSARKSAVVVANDPIPSVSKKLVTAPTPTCAGVGQPRLGRGRRGRCRNRRGWR